MSIERSKRRSGLTMLLLLVVAVAGVYWRVPSYGFVAYDDDAYVWANPDILGGLNARSVGWAFTTGRASNWHPLTWLSLAADMQITIDQGLEQVDGKPNARCFHVTNILLHIANTLLLYLILLRTTKREWPSAFVAALFAVHPLHVESVAWVTERKDVLSTLFWMLTTLGYVSYVSKPSSARYALALGAFILGLMAKPMLVSLPLVLLLMDYWPLGRFRATGNGERGKPFASRQPPTANRSLLLEKLPFFVLAAASCIVTIWMQKVTGAAGSLGAVSLGERLANAAVAYIGYIVKMVYPVGLAALYPHPLDTLLEWQVAGSAALLAALSWAAVRLAVSRPYLAVGWFWYVVTLLPVIGLVQVGRQGSADRYTYVPLIGLFIAIAWAAADLRPAAKNKKPNKLPIGLAAAAVTVVLALGVSAFVQTRYWADSTSLFTRMLGVTRDNYLAHSQLGNVLVEQQRYDEAIEQYEESIRINPDFADAHVNLGVALADSERYADAVEQYRRAIALNSKEPAIYDNMGYALVHLNDIKGAERAFLTALALDPKDVQARNNLGAIYANLGDFEAAVAEFRIALELNPNDPSIKANLDGAIAALNAKR